MAESYDDDKKQDAMDELPPLTRAEVDAKIAAITERVARGELRHREELEIWGGAVAERIAALEHRQEKVEQRLASVEERMATKQDLAALEQRVVERLLAELARHTKTIQESVTTQIAAFDDKYKDLPDRVTRIEQVLAAKPRRRRPS